MNRSPLLVACYALAGICMALLVAIFAAIFWPPSPEEVAKRIREHENLELRRKEHERSLGSLSFIAGARNQALGHNRAVQLLIGDLFHDEFMLNGKRAEFTNEDFSAATDGETLLTRREKDVAIGWKISYDDGRARRPWSLTVYHANQAYQRETLRTLEREWERMLRCLPNENYMASARMFYVVRKYLEHDLNGEGEIPDANGLYLQVAEHHQSRDTYLLTLIRDIGPDHFEFKCLVDTEVPDEPNCTLMMVWQPPARSVRE